MISRLSRAELHEMVWTISPGKIARRHNVSVAQLTEVCAERAVPMPPLSYWISRKRGKAVTIPPLPPGIDVERPMALAPHEIPQPWRFERHESLLCEDDVELLTGRKNRSLQCAALVAMKIPFTVNVGGYPLIPYSAIAGTKAEARREIKFLETRLEDSLYGCPPVYLECYRQLVKRCTSTTDK